MWYYVLDVDNKVYRVKTDKSHLELEDCYHETNCDFIQMVNCKLKNKTYSIILDEEGKLFTRPVNTWATRLWGNKYDFIVGTVVITKTNALKTFTDEQASAFEYDFKDKFDVEFIDKEPKETF